MSQEEKLRKDMPKKEINPKTYTRDTSHNTVFSLMFYVFLHLQRTLYQRELTVTLNLNRATKSNM